MYSCTFIGHSDCTSQIVDELYKNIEYLINNKKVSKFYVGTNGNFDYYVYKVLSKLKKIYNIEIIVVLAYINQNNKAYYVTELTIFPVVLENTPFKFAINKRNIFMINQSQYMICYINNSFSNSYTFVKKAISKKLEIINLGNLDISIL